MKELWKQAGRLETGEAQLLGKEDGSVGQLCQREDKQMSLKRKLMVEAEGREVNSAGGVQNLGAYCC